MKATKALKRLIHAENLISDVLERYSEDAPEIRHQLQDAKAAVGRAKDAVKSHVPSEKSARKKTAAKKAAVKVPRAKAAKKQGRTQRDYEE